MATTPYFLPHLRPHCTGNWQILRYVALNLWHCAACRALYPDCAWVREAVIREVRAGVQIRRLAQEGEPLLGDVGGRA